MRCDKRNKGDLKKNDTIFVYVFKTVKMVKNYMVNHRNSCKFHNMSEMTISKDLKK